MRTTPLRALIAAPLFVTLAATAATLQSEKFELKSPDIAPGQTVASQFVFNGFGCTGSNISPALEWHGLPHGTQSLAVMVHDPDAPTGGAGFWHWVVVNIPTSATGLARGTGSSNGLGLPAGAQQIATDFGAPGWGGPCPPVGDKPHPYNFTVYALKVEKLDLPPNATASLTGFMVNMNTLGKATFTGVYGR